MNDQTFPAINALMLDVEQKAAAEPDCLAAMVAALKSTIASEADPYLVAGALIEGLRVVISVKMPPERRADVAMNAIGLLLERLRAL